MLLPDFWADVIAIVMTDVNVTIEADVIASYELFLWQVLLPYVLADVIANCFVEDVKPHLF